MVNTPLQSYQSEAISEIARRTLAQRGRSESFRDFVSRVNKRFTWYHHCQVIANVAERVAAGEIKRLMLFVPPRHSKSETISRLFTAYYLRKHPDRWVGLTSYSSDLAYMLSKSAQEYYLLSGGSVDSRAGAIKYWQTLSGGGLWAAGVGGPITGRGYHCGLIDDPLKNAEEAGSETIRDKHREWYASTFYTRAEPNAAIVIIQTRWHEDDLSGWLLRQEAESPEYWHVVNLPAIAEPMPAFPPTCTVEPDWRVDGEALCPERYSAERLAQIRGQVGGYFFDALYQQRPTAREGEFFRVTKIGIDDVAPVGLRQVRAWDLAATSGRGDYTAGVKMGIDNENRVWILDVTRGQWSPDERDDVMRQTAQLDTRSVRVRLAQDPGQAGVDQSLRLSRMLAGWDVRSERVTGDKVVRAAGLAAQINAGNVRMVRGTWNTALLEELRTFPQGRNDDQVDAAADAFNDLTLIGQQYMQGKLLR